MLLLFVAPRRHLQAEHCPVWQSIARAMEPGGAPAGSPARRTDGADQDDWQPSSWLGRGNMVAP